MSGRLLKSPIQGVGVKCLVLKCSTQLQCYPPPEKGGTLENGIAAHLTIVHNTSEGAALAAARSYLNGR